MTQEWAQIMGLDPYELQLPLAAGEAVARWLKHRHPVNTAKLVAKDTGLDPRTVENILDGHLSGPTITRLLKAYRFALGMPFLCAVLGETYEQSITRELESVANDRRELDEREQSLRASYARLHARSTVDGGALRLVHPAHGEPIGQSGDRRRAVGD